MRAPITLARRFKGLHPADRAAILDALSPEEHARLNAVLRGKKPLRAPKLSPWLAKHLADIISDKNAPVTPASRNLIERTLHLMSEAR